MSTLTLGLRKFPSPQAATTMIPACWAATMALEMASETPAPAMLTLTTLAPFVSAKSKDATTVESLPPPAEFRHLQIIICTVQAGPDNPLPLLPTAPSTPQTRVPCPLSSSMLFVPVNALNPWLPSNGLTHILEAKSSWV